MKIKILISLFISLFIAVLSLSLSLSAAAQQPALPADSLTLASASSASTSPVVAASSAAPADSVGGALSAVDAELTAQRGDSAYMADNFTLAEQFYLQALRDGGSSTVLFYNLGNAYYRQGNLGMAIVNYERALRLDPRNADARANLEFVNSKITDRQIDSGTVMTSIWGTIVEGFSADTWAWIAIVLFALFLGCVAVYVFASAVWLRKFSFFGGLVVFFVTAAAIIIVFAAANRLTSHDEAIILPPASQLSTLPREPRNQQENAFLLHEGTKVEIIDSIANPGEGKWYEVRVGGRERAWVKAADVERV